MAWKKFLPVLIFLALLVGIIRAPSFTVRADEVQELQNQINDLNKTLSSISSANETNKRELNSLQQQIANLQARINQAKKQTDSLSASIKQREASLGVTFNRFNDRVAAQYVTRQNDWSLVLLVGRSSLGEFFREYEYRQRVRLKDQGEIQSLAAEISKFEKDKAELVATQERLKSLQASLDTNAKFLAGEVAKANKAQAEISGKIAALSAKQQEILAERTGTAQTTVGDVPLADDPNSRPTYNPGFSPAFAAFSFGAPHFKGMSQYGAYGRAKAGQNVEDILRAYYGGVELKKDYSTGININVQGHGTVDIETYVKRIYEMPNSWGDQGGFEALKAQAVAARSYALAYTDNGARSICATEACQVYKSSNKGGKWEEAVNATRGWVLVAGGKPISAWYASTSGGYQQSYTTNGHATPGFWDSTSDWTRWADGAYEAKAGSPWFYKGWYKSRSGDSCGRSHPWLTQEEFADVLNAWIVRYKGDGGEVGRIVPIGPCWPGGGYSQDEMRNVANKYGGAFTSVSGVRIEHGSNGYTKSVVVDTNKGSVSIPGAEFKTAFNLRAPGRLSIKGNLFSIEKK